MFLDLRADAGDDGDRSPWGSFWFSPVPFRGTPHSVTADAALRLTAVYACVRVIAESVSTLPFSLYTENDKGHKTPNRKHWLYKLFAERPNDFQNPMEFRETLTAHLALKGNGFARIFANAKGEVTDLIPMNPDMTTIEMLGDTNWRYRYRHSDGTESVLTRGQVFHIRALSLDGVVGMSPIAAAREAVASGLAAQDYAMRFFENDATPSGGWIEMPGKFAKEEDKKLFRQSWQESQTGRNRHKTAVLEAGMKYHAVGVSMKDSQFIESRKYSRGEIATLFRVPPHMIGDLERATFANIEQMSLEFVVYSLMPWLVRWEEAIKFSFVGDDEGINVKFPVTSLLRGDTAARASYYKSGINAGWMTRNEARIDDDRNPIAGLDEPLRPLNMSPSVKPQAARQTLAGNASAASGKPADPSKLSFTKARRLTK
ncbi:phage portal protein [Paraburkholderia graminis]|uniref:phage portal protein n=1 Tax=Paraburkholderia graminis TaxID=60548 RepID=UPI0038B81015